MEVPRTSVERFKRSRPDSVASAALSASLTLQALEWVSVGADQILEEANMVRGHARLPNNTIPQLR